MPGPLIIDSQVTVNPTAHNVSGRHGRRSAHQPGTTAPLHMVSQDAVMTGIRRPTWSCSPPINNQLLGSPLGCFWLAHVLAKVTGTTRPVARPSHIGLSGRALGSPSYPFVFVSRSCGDSSTLHLFFRFARILAMDRPADAPHSTSGATDALRAGAGSRPRSSRMRLGAVGTGEHAH